MAANKLKAKELVLDVYKDSKDFYNDNTNKFREYWSLSRGIPLKKKKKFNRFVPFIPAAIDLILPRLSGRLPIFDVVGVTEDDHTHAQTMKNVVDYFIDKTDFHDFEQKAIKSAMVYGTCITQMGWDLQKRSVHPDLEEKTDEQDRVKDEPFNTIIPLENVFPHKNKVKIQDEWPIVIREEVSRRELKNDPNIDNASLGQVGEAKSDDDFFDQRNKGNNRSNQTNNDNPTEDKDNDVLVKLTYWGSFDGDEYVITVVNFENVVRLERNPFWHQRKPFAKLDYQPDSEQFFSEGMVSQLRDSQLELNELRNVRSKARSIALKTPLLVDRAANVNLAELKWENSAVWLYDPTQNPNPIQPVNIPSKLLELDREEITVKGDMQLRSGMNDVVVGSDEVGIAGGDTATGAAIAAEQTSLRFKTQSLQIDQWIKDIGEQTIFNIQQFVDRDKAFKIFGEDGFEWKEYSAELMRQFSFDFKVSPMSTFVEPKAAKRDKLIMIKQLYAEDPSINQDKLDRMILESFDIDADQIKKPQEQQEREALEADLSQLSQVISDPSFTQMPPEEQQAIQQQYEQLKQQLQQQDQLETEGALPGGGQDQLPPEMGL